jgi:hypothetical protein
MILQNPYLCCVAIRVWRSGIGGVLDALRFKAWETAFSLL